MKYGYAIAIARNLFEAGRLREVDLMLEPVLHETGPNLQDEDHLMVQALLVRSRLFQHGPAEQALPIDEALVRKASGSALDPLLAAELLLTKGWIHALNFEDGSAPFMALRFLHRSAALFKAHKNPAYHAWSVLGQAQAYGTLSEWPKMQATLDQLADAMPFIQDRLAQYWYADLQTYYALVARDLKSVRKGLASMKSHPLSKGIPYCQNRLHSYGQLLQSLEETPATAEEIAQKHASPPCFPDLICLSPAMQLTSKQVYAATMSELPVLIRGENGTGKAWIAKQMHSQKLGQEAPFIYMNCQEIPPELHEGTLFGRIQPEAGTISEGALDEARGGSLFIEGIEHLSRDAQTALSRHLETLLARKKAGLSFSAPRFILAATECSLEQEVEKGRFNARLLTCLCGSIIEIPPLRQRTLDIPGLVKSMLDAMHPSDIPVVTATREVMLAFQRYNWPGNVRQLHNELDRIMTQSAFEPSTVIDLNHISKEIAHPDSSQRTASYSFSNDYAPLDLNAIMARTEKRIIEETLADNDGQVAASARVLGLTRQGLYKKIKRLDISLDRETPRPASQGIRS